MLTLIVVWLVMAAALAVLLLAGSLFAQNYLYTEYSPGIFWQAPAAAAAVTLFLVLWGLLNIAATPPGEIQVPFDTVFAARWDYDLVKEPVPKLWVNEKGKKEPSLYLRYKFYDGVTSATEYKEAGSQRRWSPLNVEAVIIEYDKQKLRFEPRSSATGYRQFVSPEGWVMPEYDRGVTGVPSGVFFGQYLLALLINFLFLGLLVVCLWLIVRFQFWHAFFFAFCLWLGFQFLAYLTSFMTWTVSLTRA